MTASTIQAAPPRREAGPARVTFVPAAHFRAGWPWILADKDSRECTPSPTHAPDPDGLVPSLDALRRLTVAETADLAQALRSLLVEKVCARGGHMGSNLGVVELTLALHRVFKSPRDALVFDIGHQAYIHKMLTGRAAAFDRLRQAGGLSGYPARGNPNMMWWRTPMPPPPSRMHKDLPGPTSSQVRRIAGWWR